MQKLHSIGVRDGRAHGDSEGAGRYIPGAHVLGTGEPPAWVGKRQGLGHQPLSTIFI